MPRSINLASFTEGEPAELSLLCPLHTSGDEQRPKSSLFLMAILNNTFFPVLLGDLGSHFLFWWGKRKALARGGILSGIHKLVCFSYYTYFPKQDL